MPFLALLSLAFHKNGVLKKQGFGVTGALEVIRKENDVVDIEVSVFIECIGVDNKISSWYDNQFIALGIASSSQNFSLEVSNIFNNQLFLINTANRTISTLVSTYRHQIIGDKEN